MMYLTLATRNESAQFATHLGSMGTKTIFLIYSNILHISSMAFYLTLFYGARGISHRMQQLKWMNPSVLRVKNTLK